MNIKSQMHTSREFDALFSKYMYILEYFERKCVGQRSVSDLV